MKLEEINPNKKIDPVKFRKEEKKYNNEIEEINNLIKEENLRLIIGFEGWDGAGKDTCIKSLVSNLDPAKYKVYPMAYPSEDERKMPYLWRAWSKIPPTGETTIFDRTWYDRVLVDRVERRIADTEWNRAYKEINDFEKLLADDDTILMKFFIHISKDEQEKRFEERENNPKKRLDIDPEDYKNRAKWDLYLKAYNEMLRKTNKDYSPWHVVESNDRNFSQIKVMKLFVEDFYKGLERISKHRKQVEKRKTLYEKTKRS